MKITNILKNQVETENSTIEDDSLQSLTQLNGHIKRLVDLVGNRVESLSEEDLDDYSPAQLIKLIETLSKASNAVAENVQRIRGLEAEHKELHQHLHIHKADDVRSLPTEELLKLLGNG